MKKHKYAISPVTTNLITAGARYKIKKETETSFWIKKATIYKVGQA